MVDLNKHQTTTLVIGSNGGIGQSFCEILTKKQYVYLGLDKIISNKLKNHYEIDSSSSNDLQNLLDKYPELFSSIGQIVCCAGTYSRHTLDQYSENEPHQCFQDNFFANITPIHLLLTTHRYCLAPTAKIVVVSSLAGHFGGADPYYSSTKGAVFSFIKSIAREYGSKGIRINCVAPGPMDNKMSQVMGEERKTYYKSTIPTGNLITNMEVAQQIYYLCFDAPDSVHGSVIDIDGGLIRR